MSFPAGMSKRKGGGVAVRAGLVVQGRGGRFEASAGSDARDEGGGLLTESQRAFVEAFCSNGGQGKAAAVQAGYEGHHAAARLLTLPHVRQAISSTLARRVGTEGATLAWGCVMHLLADPLTPSAVRFQAARWTLEAAGIGGAGGQSAGAGIDASGLASLSIEDLEKIVQIGRQALSDLTIVDAPPPAPPPNSTSSNLSG